MLTRIVVAWTPAALSLLLLACGSKGDLALPKKAPVAQSAAQPAALPTPPVAPSPAKQP